MSKARSIRDPQLLLERLRDVHAAIRDAVIAACERSAIEHVAAAVDDASGDTIFAIDRVSEHALLEHFALLAEDWSFVLVGEGIGATGEVVLPSGARVEDAELRIIVDPIDGTRGLMYQKRPAWILTGVAPNRGAATSLADVTLALQTEIPLLKQHLCDALWVVEGRVGGERLNRLTGERVAFVPRPSRATTIEQGYGGLARFFPGARDVLAAVDDAVVRRVLGEPKAGRALAFEDQYISTGGQLYELLMGHDRWIADLRPLVGPLLRQRGQVLGLCCHPYDLCTESIARAAGVIVTDEEGGQLAAPLATTTDVAWIGYANAEIARLVRPALSAALHEYGLLPYVIHRRALREDDASVRRELPGEDAFVAKVAEVWRDPQPLFENGAPVVVTRAPGRLDLMGGIADYSGSLVLQLPLEAATFAAAQLTYDERLVVRTLAPPSRDAHAEVMIAGRSLASAGGVAIDYGAAHALLTDDPAGAWAAYALGALVVLARERGVRLTRGLRLLVDSTVPAGKGVSSSAALEVAVMQALARLFGVTLDGRELALLSQLVENRVVGAPCGVMDQMTAALGEKDRLLALLCQPAEVQGHVPLPADLEIWGIDSGIRHEVGGAEYGDVRVGAFMGYRIVAALAGLQASRASGDRVRIDDTRWSGYLANVTPAEWESELRDRVPVAMAGAEFLERYGGTTDPVTRVDPSRTYAVRQPTAHPIYEHDRVRRFRELLERPAAGGAQWGELGELMYGSHASYGACGLGSSGTDRLVELVRAAGAAAGLYGAKITGGGSGGTVAVLARRGSAEVIARIAREYERETGLAATVLTGSSPGATQRLRLLETEQRSAT